MPSVAGGRVAHSSSAWQQGGRKGHSQNIGSERQSAPGCNGCSNERPARSSASAVTALPSPYSSSSLSSAIAAPAAVAGGAGLEETSLSASASFVSYSSSSPSMASSNAALSNRWSFSCIRIDSRIPIEATAPENVTVPPPTSQPAQQAYGRILGATGASARYSANSRRVPHDFSGTPHSRTNKVHVSSPLDTGTTAGKSSLPSGSTSGALPLVSFCCNVYVNLKASGFRDSDTQQLTRMLEERLSAVTVPSDTASRGGPTPNSVPVSRDFPESASSTLSAKDHKAQSGAKATGVESGSVRSTAFSPGVLFFVSLDLSENELTCQGIAYLAKWFLRHLHNIRLRVLKVYKNLISDGGALTLAELISKQPSPLEELHLSHNRIKTHGAEALFKSIGFAQFSCFVKSKGGGCVQRQNYVYPRMDSNRQDVLPVWIRLEYNNINDTHALLQKWEAEVRSVRAFDPQLKLACFADRLNHPHGSKDPHCSPARCLRAVNGHAPLLHLYSFYHQSTGDGAAAAAAAAAVGGSAFSHHTNAGNVGDRCKTHNDMTRADSSGVRGATTNASAAPVCGKVGRRAADHNTKNQSSNQTKRAGKTTGVPETRSVPEKQKNAPSHRETQHRQDAKSNEATASSVLLSPPSSLPESSSAGLRQEEKNSTRLVQDRLVAQLGPPPAVPVPKLPGPPTAAKSTPLSTSEPSRRSSRPSEASQQTDGTFNCITVSRQNDINASPLLPMDNSDVADDRGFPSQAGENSNAQLQYERFAQPKAVQRTIDVQDNPATADMASCSLSAVFRQHPQWKALNSLGIHASALDGIEIVDSAVVGMGKPCRQHTLCGTEASLPQDLSSESALDSNNQSKLAFWRGFGGRPLTSQPLQHRLGRVSATTGYPAHSPPDSGSNYTRELYEAQGTVLSSTQGDNSNGVAAVTGSLPDDNSVCSGDQNRQRQGVVHAPHTTGLLRGDASSAATRHTVSPVLHLGKNPTSEAQVESAMFSNESAGDSVPGSHYAAYNTAGAGLSNAVRHRTVAQFGSLADESSFHEDRGVVHFPDVPNTTVHEEFQRASCSASPQYEKCSVTYPPYGSSLARAGRQSLEGTIVDREFRSNNDDAIEPSTGTAHTTSVVPQRESGDGPLYIFVDASAFVEMRKLCKNEKINLFSFPGFFSLYQQHLLCHSLMAPLTRLGPNGVEALDSTQSIILMCVDMVEKGIAKITESQPFLREALLEVHNDFILPLTRCGVVEKLDGISEKRMYPSYWMTLDKTLCEEAKTVESFAVDALRVIDFACVWSCHLDRVSRERGEPPRNVTAPSQPDITAPFSLFVTANPKVEKFFSSLVATVAARRDKLRYAPGETLPQDGKYAKLLCIHVDRLNAILRDGFPRLETLVAQPGGFDCHPAPSRCVTEILSAEALRNVIRQRLRVFDDLLLDSRDLFNVLTHDFSSFASAPCEAKPSDGGTRQPVSHGETRGPSDPATACNGLTRVPTQSCSGVNASYLLTDKSAVHLPEGPRCMDQEVSRLRTANIQLREEVTRAYVLVSEILKFQQSSEACSADETVFAHLNPLLLRHCREECLHWRHLLFNDSSFCANQQASFAEDHRTIDMFLSAEERSTGVAAGQPNKSGFSSQMLCGGDPRGATAAATPGRGAVTHPPPGMEAIPSQHENNMNNGTAPAPLRPQRLRFASGSGGAGLAPSTGSPPRTAHGGEEQRAHMDRVPGSFCVDTTGTPGYPSLNMTHGGVSGTDSGTRPPPRGLMRQEYSRATAARQLCTNNGGTTWNDEVQQRAPGSSSGLSTSHFSDTPTTSPVFRLLGQQPSPKLVNSSPPSSDPAELIRQHLFAAPTPGHDFPTTRSSNSIASSLRFAIQ